MKKIMVTGATDGIGRETAKVLAKRNYNLIIHGRDREKAETVKKELKEINDQPDYYIEIADLASQEKVIEMGERVKGYHDHLNVLINNAGIFKNKHEYSTDGIEKTIAVNYHSHYILTLLLFDIIKQQNYSRIINVSSITHSNQIDLDDIWDPVNFDGMKAYSDSKLCMILFTFYLAELLQGQTAVNCLDPGVIDTKLLRKGWGFGGSPVEKGAKTPVYLADSEDIAGETGNYYGNKQKKQPARIAYDKELQRKLWKKSKEMIKFDIRKELPQ